MSSGKMLRIGKKLSFPDAPSTWIPRTVESILESQDCVKRKPNLVRPDSSYGYDALDTSSCNPYSRDRTTRVTTTSSTSNNVQQHNVVTTTTVGRDIKDGYIWSRNNYSIASRFYFDNRYKWGLTPPLMEGDALDVIKEEDAFDVIKEGEAFDVISLLKSNGETGSNNDDGNYLVRNNGEKVLVDSLQGKNILVCCVFVPGFWMFDCVSNSLRGLFTLYQHQNKNAKVKSEMTETVIVAKIKPKWGSNNRDDDEDVFNHFFSGFPSSWLAVPFSDTLRRDHVCNSIGLVDHPMALLVDPNQKVVLHRESYGDNGIRDFCDPDDEDSWWKKYTQLDMILDLDSHYVFKTNDYHSNRKVSISELKEKVVGLYLCFDGTFIQTLDLIYQECKAQDKEFEVVLVYLPYKEGVNPPLFQEAINHVLHKLNITNWWVSPFDDFVSRRLWEAIQFAEEDYLAILDPHMNIADPFAKTVVDLGGVNTYPFTRESILLRELEALEAVTLESLLVYGSRDHVLRIDDNDNVEEVPIAQLRGKNVMLYADDSEKPKPEYYNKLLEWYNSMKATKVANDFEVVFISAKPFGSPKLLPVPMPWLVCPFDPQHKTFVSRKILKTCYERYLVPFGKDGHIIKLHGSDLLDKDWPDGFPPYRGLCTQDILDYFEGCYYDYDIIGAFSSYDSQ